jgi:hypothetical protein
MTHGTSVFPTLSDAATIILRRRIPHRLIVRVMSDPSDPPDLQRLAARYFDLWQEQVASMAGDPQLADLMAKSFSMAKERWDEAGHQFRQGGDDKHPAQPARAAASGVSSADAGQQLDRILERLAGLEERLGKLEKAMVGRGKRASKPDKPSRSAKLPKSSG